MIDRGLVIATIRKIMADDEETDDHFLGLGNAEMSRMIFHMPVASDGNVRLSQTGFEFLKRAFESHEIPFAEDYYLKSRDLLFLKQNCSCPYYVAQKAKYFGFFEVELASRLRLVGGNLSLLF